MYGDENIPGFYLSVILFTRKSPPFCPETVLGSFINLDLSYDFLYQESFLTFFCFYVIWEMKIVFSYHSDVKSCVDLNMYIIRLSFRTRGQQWMLMDGRKCDVAEATATLDNFPKWHLLCLGLWVFIIRNIELNNQKSWRKLWEKKESRVILNSDKNVWII